MEIPAYRLITMQLNVRTQQVLEILTLIPMKIQNGTKYIISFGRHSTHNEKKYIKNPHRPEKLFCLL